jgi:superfamily I DNA and/or RNA helicase/very-short-patch-repair endonuclease
VADKTDEALIRHEASKENRHIAVRALFKRAGRALAVLKPCMLMSPYAVAQYLGRGQFHFDLIITDEASQMRPEDCLGVLARGNQAVVVGDTKQLGPTSFFERVQQDDGTDDLAEASLPEEAGIDAPVDAGTGTVLQRSESILHVARDLFPIRTLQWHYRSRHPKLIAFSNREFYNDRLIVFPRPTSSEPFLGVHFVRVPDGLWDQHRNAPEAMAVVAAARRHAAEHPDKSLLIATMNREQADFIDDLLTRAEKEDAVFASYRQRWELRPDAEEQQPVVVKNLENVQGDERDVILVSVGYGPDAKGNLYQRFGPINGKGGERRLNVLFTRARHRLEVFCSFDPADLQVTGASARGLRVFQQYLLYAQDEQWAMGTTSGRPPDSDFEVAVADALAANGFEVRCQIGVAGFFVDLAVVDPTQPTRFLLGIECDGVAWHSSKSARDRDRLRQRILEGLGWSIHRIWSTDWYRDPAAQIARVLHRLAEIEMLQRPSN